METNIKKKRKWTVWEPGEPGTTDPKKRTNGPGGDGPEPQQQRNNEHAKLPGGGYGCYKRIREQVISSTRTTTDPFGQVVNLSEEGFTKMEYKLLGYNLNFIPTPDKINKKEILDNVNNFNRGVKLKSHFGDTPPKEGLYFKSNSSWEPPNPHYTVKTFTENFKNNMIKSLDKKK